MKLPFKIVLAANAIIAAIAMSTGISHPINDPSLVSYHRPELVKILPQLEQAKDCWHLLNTDGLGSAKSKYLHREPAEPAPAYQARLERSTYAPIFRDSIRAYAGLLSRFQVMDAPASMIENDDNVDLQGSSMQSFMTQVDELTLRDGGSFVMIDIMPGNGVDNFFDQMADGRHPYLICVNRSDVINWNVSYDRGVETVEQVTVRQLRSIPDPEGAFGSKIEPIYYVLTPGKVETYKVVRSDARRWTNQKIEEISVSLPIVPLIWYGATTSRFAQGDLPMAGLADLSIQHFQMRSDLAELLHKCAMPVPVRKGAPLGVDGNPLPLVMGPNTAVDLSSEGGEFKFAEPSGQSLQRHQAEIQHVEELMDRSSLNFLYGANVATATEASLKASQIASSVSALVRNKIAMFNVVMRVWAWFAGEQDQITDESGLAINDSLMNRPLEASEIAQLVNLFNNELLSRQTVLDELQRGGVLDPDLIIEEEIDRIKEGHNETQDQMMADAEKELKQDLARAEEFEKIAPSEPQVESEKTIKPTKTEQEKVKMAAEQAK